MSEFNLDREVSIEKNVDSFGKRWVIHANRGNGLCYVRPDPDRSDAVIPKEMKGLWTKPSLLQVQLDKYLNDTWDHAEQAAQKAARKAHAKKATDDAGTANK